MTQVISVELPETVYSVLHCSPSELDKELRLAASAHWYQQGRISQEWAAKIAGMGSHRFSVSTGSHGQRFIRGRFQRPGRRVGPWLTRRSLMPPH